MLKIIAEKWAARQNLLRAKLAQINIDNLNYLDLVKVTFSTIYNDEDYLSLNIDVEKITEIDNGDYQGTLLYVLPFSNYHPSETDYFITYVDYGSCSGCDTLKRIQSLGDWDQETPNEAQINDLMKLCGDILVNTIQPYYSSPYNYYKDEFKEIKYVHED